MKEFIVAAPLNLRASCDACGKSKKKCSGADPCANCLKWGVECIYGPRKRVENMHKRVRLSEKERALMLSGAWVEYEPNARPGIKHPRYNNLSKKKVYANECDSSLLPTQPASTYAPTSFKIGDCRYLQDYLDTYNRAIPVLCPTMIAFLCSTDDADVEDEDRMTPLSAAAPDTFSGVPTVTPEVTPAEGDIFAFADLKPSANPQMDETDAGKYENESEWDASEASHAYQAKGKSGTYVSKNIIQFANLTTFVDISDACVADTGAAKSDNCSMGTRDDDNVCSCDLKDDFAVMAVLHCACAFISIFQFKDASIIIQHVASARKCCAVATKNTSSPSPYLSRAYAALELVRLVNPSRAPAEAIELNYVHMSEHHVERLTWSQQLGEKGYAYFLLSLIHSWQEMSVPSGDESFQSPLQTHEFQHTCGNIGQLLTRTEVKGRSQEFFQISEETQGFRSNLSVARRPPELSTKLIGSSSMQGYAQRREQFLFPTVSVSYTIEQDDMIPEKQGQEQKQEQEQHNPSETQAMTEEEEQGVLLQGALELRNKLGCSETFVHYANYKLLYWHRRLKAAESICVSPRSPHFQSGACYAGANTDEPFQQNAYPDADTSKSHEDLDQIHACDYLCDYDEYKNDLALAQMLFQSDRPEEENLCGAPFNLMTDSCVEVFAYLFLRFSACMHHFYGVLAEEENAQKKDLHNTHKKPRREQINEIENDFFSLGHFIMKRPHIICTPQSVYVSITVDQMHSNIVLLKASAGFDDLGRASRSSATTGRFITRELSHSLRTFSIIEPMREVAKKNYISLPYNVFLTNQLCSVLDLSGKMLEISPSDPAAIMPPGVNSGAYDHLYSSDDYLLELSIMESNPVHTGSNAFVESEMAGQFQWNKNEENMGSFGNCVGIGMKRKFNRYEKTYGADRPVYSHPLHFIGAGEVAEPPNVVPSLWLPEPLEMPVKRKPGRPRKIHPPSAAEKEAMQIADIREHFFLEGANDFFVG